MIMNRIPGRPYPQTGPQCPSESDRPRAGPGRPGDTRASGHAGEIFNLTKILSRCLGRDSSCHSGRPGTGTRGRHESQRRRPASRWPRPHWQPEAARPGPGLRMCRVTVPSTSTREPAALTSDPAAPASRRAWPCRLSRWCPVVTSHESSDPSPTRINCFVVNVDACL